MQIKQNLKIIDLLQNKKFFFGAKQNTCTCINKAILYMHQ